MRIANEELAGGFAGWSGGLFTLGRGLVSAGVKKLLSDREQHKKTAPPETDMTRIVNI